MKNIKNLSLKNLLGTFTVLTILAFLTNTENLIFGSTAGIVPILTSLAWTAMAVVLLTLPSAKRSMAYDCMTTAYSLCLTAFGLTFFPGLEMSEHIFSYVCILILGTPYTGVFNLTESIVSSFANVGTDAVACFILTAIGLLGIAFSAMSLFKRYAAEKKSLLQTAA